jgi:hypothetical protein
MQKEHGKDLVIITVSLDISYNLDSPKAEMQKKAQKMLQQHGVNLINLVLDEPQEVVEEKLRFNAPPCVYLFSRDGKWRQLTNMEEVQVSPEVIDPLVEKLLKAK